MRSTLRNIGVAICLLSIPLTAEAIKDPETGQHFADTTTCGGQPAQVVGVGVREAMMGIDVYAVAIYASKAAQTDSSLQKTSGCVKILDRFVRNVPASKIRDAWHKGFKQQGISASDPLLKQFMAAVDSDMKKHGFMVLEIDQDRVFYRYQKRSVSLTKASALGRAIKAIYLGPSSAIPTLVKSVKALGRARP
ncbi:MAG: chalcone isomerase family protein [Deltaproteobacteria bacterium]|nr:chalcone isomerase family protein [Deltaproteobacteria bacterium]